VGERIRLFVGNGGPNLTSSFHVIGEIFDTVYPEGGSQPTHNIQTTEIPAGGAAIVEFKVDVPGTYVLVDHALFRSFNKGALGMLKVEGPENLLVYTGKEVDAVYLGRAAEQDMVGKRVAALRAQVNEEIKNNPKIAGLTKDSGQIPPLAKSDFLMSGDRDNIIRGVLMGRTGEITVNGKKYNGTMVPQNNLTDDEIANVLTYVRNNWGNNGDAIRPLEVARIRQEAPPPPSVSKFE
jgi:nitrite reductase (NO-forming)